MDIEILDFEGEGYSPVLAFGTWRVAVLNYRDTLKKENLTYLERHLLTDEAFILMEGEATLIIGEEKREYAMDKYKVYNVKQNAWHAITLSTDAKVLIVENDDTSSANTEYIDIITKEKMFR